MNDTTTSEEAAAEVGAARLSGLLEQPVIDPLNELAIEIHELIGLIPDTSLRLKRMRSLLNVIRQRREADHDCITELKQTIAKLNPRLMAPREL